eukprot:COSAG01_NODE_7365_length_3235_cov_112.430804_2_plen_155_part_00
MMNHHCRGWCASAAAYSLAPAAWRRATAAVQLLRTGARAPVALRWTAAAAREMTVTPLTPPLLLYPCCRRATAGWQGQGRRGMAGLPENQQIRVQSMRVIGSGGEELGVMSRDEVRATEAVPADPGSLQCDSPIWMRARAVGWGCLYGVLAGPG